MNKQYEAWTPFLSTDMATDIDMLRFTWKLTATKDVPLELIMREAEELLENKHAT